MTVASSKQPAVPGTRAKLRNASGPFGPLYGAAVKKCDRPSIMNLESLIVGYLKLSLVFGPLIFAYTLWDARHHPIFDPMVLHPIKAIEYVRIFGFCFVAWPILLPFIVIGYIASVIFYFRTGVWPP